ncbi:cytochrome b [Bombella sp. TMW 2.2559]|uniref:Cytochrome b n=1 Tax=Bombella dulcis TaxID=2967339 RepID=A0ABT3WCI9_9PROT|nr:cytochrome b [Bombella dulcis]MCX5616084.1 cytochrome b [Bombella dulcis]
MSEKVEMMTGEPSRHNAVSIFLHWVIALLVFFMIGLGLYMDHVPVSNSGFLHQFHKSVGIVTMLLIVVRVIWRLTHKAPALPKDLSAAQRVVAGGMEGLLYLYQIFVPATGWLMVSSMAMPIVLFGLVSWPLIPLPQSVMDSGTLAEVMPDIHNWLAWTFGGFIALHVLAALYHRFIRKDQVVNRILPRHGSGR